MVYTDLKAFKTINAYQIIKMPVLHDNNNNDTTATMTTTTTTHVDTIEIDPPKNEIHTKCRAIKKLEKIDISKSRSLDSIEDPP